MALQLFALPDYPDQIAVTEVGMYIVDGTFFLDFSRPLKPRRRLFGGVVGMLVPVIHQGEHYGGYVIGVDRSEPVFQELLMLWQERYPTARIPPIQSAKGVQISADFARQFPM